MQRELNQKVINQLFYNIDYMDETTENLLLSLYFNNDIISLMNSKNIEIYDLYPKLNTLEDTVNTYSFVDSIVVYNVHNRCYYSSNFKSSCQDDGLNQVVDRYLKSNTPVPKLKFVPLMKDPSKNETHFRSDYFSMFYYRTSNNSVQDSSITINIKPEWLFNNVSSLNELIKYKGSSILLADSEYRIFNQKNESDQQLNEIINILKSRSNKNEGAFIYEINKEKQIISYKKSTKSDWTIINLIPYDEVMSNVSYLKNKMIIGTIIILIIAMIVALVLAYNLYKPIMNIMMKIAHPTNSEHSVGLFDELAFINNQFINTSKNIELLKKDQQNNKNIVKNYLLRKCIISNSQMGLVEVKAQQEYLNLQLNLDGEFILCVITIDQFDSYKQMYSENEQKDYEFAIANIAHEIFLETLKNEIFHIRNNHFVMVINSEQNKDAYPFIVDKLQQVQQTIKNYYDISLSATVSKPITNFELLAANYSITYDYSMYRLIHGHGSIIIPEMIEDNIQNFNFQFPVEIERKFTEGIKANDRMLQSEQLDSLFAYMKDLSYNNIMYLLSHIFVLIQRTIREINQNTVQPIMVDLKIYHQKLFELETLDEIQEMFNTFLDEVNQYRKGSVKKDTNDLIVDTIKEIVEENYKDMNLSLKGIADMLRLSPTHANRIFKQAESLSIAEYIKEVRLNYSIELLMKKNYTVNEIMEEVGFGNQSYFFRVFKKKFGVTPKEYQRSKLLKVL